MANSMLENITKRFPRLGFYLSKIVRYAKLLINFVSMITIGMPLAKTEDNAFFSRMAGGLFNVGLLIVGLVARISDSCPAQPWIPDYLLMVAGVNLILKPSAFLPELNFVEVLIKEIVACALSYKGYRWINKVPILYDYYHCHHHIYFIASWLNWISLLFSAWIFGCMVMVVLVICTIL